MATNQKLNVRTILVPNLDIQALTNTQILQLIQSETTAGAQADVGLLQVGDIVAVLPGDVDNIDELHSDFVADEGEKASRMFMVIPIAGAPGSTPAERHVLAELGTTDTLFW